MEPQRDGQGFTNGGNGLPGPAPAGPQPFQPPVPGAPQSPSAAPAAPGLPSQTFGPSALPVSGPEAAPDASTQFQPGAFGLDAPSPETASVPIAGPQPSFVPGQPPQQPAGMAGPQQFGPPLPPQSSRPINPGPQPFGPAQQQYGPGLQPSQQYGGYPQQQGMPGRGPQMMQARPRKKKRVLTAVILAGLLVLGGGTGAVFGLYLPNTPANVWNTGLDRTGETMEKLTLDATSKEKLAAYETSELTGDIEITAEGSAYKGDLTAKYDENSADSSISVSFDDPSGKKDIGLQLLAEMAQGKELPDMYFKFSGLKAMGLAEMVPGLSEYDGRWIGVPADYLERYLDAEDKAEATKDQLTHEDATALAKIVMADTRKYLFTSDPQYAVFVQKSFVGTESLDAGISANHYVVGINKANAKAYCQAIIGDVMAAPAYRKLPGVAASTIDADKTTAIEDCKKSIDDDIKDSDSFDMWIDREYKLIHKVRFTDETDREDYVELGQNFQGGDKIPMFIAMQSKSEGYEGRMTLDVDVRQSATSGTFNFKQTKDGDMTAKAKFSFKPYQGEVTVQRPSGAIPITDVFKKLGVDPDAMLPDSN